LEISKSIEPLVEELNSILKKASEIKKVINQICALEGNQPMYLDVDYTPSVNGSSISTDQFFGKGLSTAAKEYLRMRGRAATGQEIFEALKKGGFQFQDKGKDQLKNFTNSLSKNRYDFVMVPGLEENSYGLWEFYPDKVKEKGKKKADLLINERLAKDSEENKDIKE
jgi:hypothetical protein